MWFLCVYICKRETMKLTVKYKAALVLMAAFFMSACSQTKETKVMEKNKANTSGYDTATFGAGCFWCVEAVFQQLKGVVKVTSGYSGGDVKNPSYEQVCSGTTGAAEVAQIVYDPKVISFKELLEVFWQTHDPTTINRQGNDVGTQYRSAVFYHNEEQKKLAEKYKDELNKSGAWDKPLVTKIEPFTAFYPAESYHQNYYNQNQDAPYCTYMIRPKLDKFKKAFHDKLK